MRWCCLVLHNPVFALVRGLYLPHPEPLQMILGAVVMQRVLEGRRHALTLQRCRRELITLLYVSMRWSILSLVCRLRSGLRGNEGLKRTPFDRVALIDSCVTLSRLHLDLFTFVFLWWQAAVIQRNVI